MRRTLAVAVLAAATALPLLPGLPASADFTVDTPSLTPAPSSATVPDADEQAQQALATVAALLDGSSARAGHARTAETHEADLTLALRDLYVALPRLGGEDREQAEAYLARPTDGSGDRFGDGYTVPATKKCGGNFCVHYVTSTADAPPSAGWVGFVLGQMNKVWKHEVKRMGYRKPPSDKPLGSRNGGNGKFDVYLKDIGGRGLYGYCAPEASIGKKSLWRAISYCVLDDDFARAQFGTDPKATLRVTAAHEFFHAVQFAYDYGEDRWFMESTATWMEERYADKVDDNRQYLPSSQVRLPYAPLDTFSSTGSFQYGNWVFWEYLGKRFGQGFVRSVWSATAPQRNGRNTYAINAVKQLTKKRGGFTKVYSTFAAANLYPQRTYPEGKAWPSPDIAGYVKLSKSHRYDGGRIGIYHLAASHVRVRADKSLSSRRWKLRIKVDGPGRSSSPAVVVSVRHQGGPVTRTVVRLSKKGGGKVTVPFSRKRVKDVTVTVVNASTRFACYRADPSADLQFSCQGNAKDDGKVFGLKFWAVKTKR